METRRIKIVLILLIVLCFGVFMGCDTDEQRELTKIVGNHTIVDEDLDIYLLIQNKPVYEEGKTINKQSITIYSDFLKEIYKGELYEPKRYKFENIDFNSVCTCIPMLLQ